MSITIIIGCMSSGKTEELLRLAKRYEIGKKKVLYVKPSIDTREDKIYTHNGNNKSCIIVKKLSEIIIDIKTYDIIAIDEIQFFDDCEEMCDYFANNGYIVIAAGLDSNFQRNAFKNVTNLISKAEKVIKLSAICDICGNKASFSKRIDINNKNLIEIGNKDKYQSVCRKCF